MRKEEDKAELEAIGLFCNFQWKPFWNAYGNNYHGRCKRRAIFTPREFFERPAVPFIVFHLPDTVQSIHASLNIPPPLPRFPFPRARIQNNRLIPSFEPRGQIEYRNFHR